MWSSETNPRHARSSSLKGRTIKTNKDRRPSLCTETLKDGMVCLANSEKDICSAKEKVASLLERERQAIAEFEDNNNTAEPESSSSVFSDLKNWMQLRLETGKAQRKVKGDLKKAQKAMEAAEDMIVRMEDTLNLEEDHLNHRANALRRLSLGAFKVMPPSVKRFSLDNETFDFDPAQVTQEEPAEVMADDGLRFSPIDGLEDEDDDFKEEFDEDTDDDRVTWAKENAF